MAGTDPRTQPARPVMQRSRSTDKRRHRRSYGFTLLEVLLSLFLVSILLAAVSALIVSLFLMWDNTRQADVRTRTFAVAGWLERRLELNPHVDDTQGWQMNWPDDERTSAPPSLAWTSPIREMIIPNSTSGGIWEYRLHLEPREGLFVAWRPRNRVDDTDYHYSLLSRDISGLRFAYFDPESGRWDVYDSPPAPERVDNRLPQLLALDYSVGSTLQTIWIGLP